MLAAAYGVATGATATIARPSRLAKTCDQRTRLVSIISTKRVRVAGVYGFAFGVCVNGDASRHRRIASSTARASRPR